MDPLMMKFLLLILELLRQRCQIDSWMNESEFLSFAYRLLLVLCMRARWIRKKAQHKMKA